MKLHQMRNDSVLFGLDFPSQHKNVGPTLAIGGHRRPIGVGADVGCSSSARRRKRRQADVLHTFLMPFRRISDLLPARIERRPDVKMTLARLPKIIFYLFPTVCPPELNVGPTKKCP